MSADLRARMHDLADKWERQGEYARANELRAALGEPGNVRVSSTGSWLNEKRGDES